MKPQPKKRTLKEFTQEFELRQRFTWSLHHLNLKRVIDFRTARQIMLN
jgi:hypothetical protein